MEDAESSGWRFQINVGFQVEKGLPLAILYLDSRLEVRRLVMTGFLSSWGRKAFERGELTVDPSSEEWQEEWLSRSRRFGALAEATSTL